jgi:phenylacetic acid degradation protein
MNSVIMDNAEIGDESIIGALSFIKSGEMIPPRSVVAGSPAKIIRPVSDEMLEWKSEGTALYQALPKDMHEHWTPCEQLREPPGDPQADPSQPISTRSEGTPVYKPWKETRND